MQMPFRFPYGRVAILVAALVPLPQSSGAQAKNAPWQGADIERMVRQLESESRPVYRERVRLATLVAPRKGTVVADVGAGSGFMSELFAGHVGPAGKVYAVEVNPGLVAHLSGRTRQLGLRNVEAVLTRPDALDLPADSVDLAFLCLTYRFIEQPRAVMAGVYKAVRPGGELVIVEAEDSELGDPRKLTRDISGDGFKLLRAEATKFLPSDYFVLRFRKPK